MKYFSTPQNKTLGEATNSELWQEIKRREQQKIQQRSVGISYSKQEIKAPGVMKTSW